ncbi:MAG: NnrU family protein, partial [Pseudomonadota bacterium]|nr:NnrU family protein [Pseudomonadota bacterium]
MELLILGLVLFVGGHSVNLFAHQWRDAMVGKIGLLPWKGLYSILAIAGLICLVYGYGEARAEALYLWQPP